MSVEPSDADNPPHIQPTAAVAPVFARSGGTTMPGSKRQIFIGLGVVWMLMGLIAVAILNLHGAQRHQTAASWTTAATGATDVTPAMIPAPAPTGAAVVRSGPTASFGRCQEATALPCLPKSSGDVVFDKSAAANLAAAENIRDGLSTSQAEANAIKEGASGKSARLCGIVRSNDSSPLGKHLAAIRLNNPHHTDGQASGACMTFANNFL
jgi:hypothetical protein